MTRQLSPRPRRGRWLALVLAAMGLSLLFFIALAAYVSQSSPPHVAPSPTAVTTPTGTAAPTTPPATTAPPTAAATTAALSGPCANRYIQGDDALVPPRDSGRYLDVALDDVFTGPTGRSRWAVRYFVEPGAPGNANVPLDATVTGPGGQLASFRYESGPPNAGTTPATEPVTVEPCDASAPPGTSRGPVVVLVETAQITTGTYTVTWKGIRLPEGGTRDETWTVTLICDNSTPGAACRKG